MRNFTVRRGNFKGNHKVYDSIEEANKHNITKIKSPWHDPDVAIGDWVIADDGYIVQCLHRRQVVNKRHRNGQYTDLFRFPQGTFYVYYDKRGIPRIKNFYAQMTNNHKSSMGGGSRLGRYMTVKKREFVLYMSMGYDPYTSYVKAFRVGMSTPQHITMQINKLLDDELVKEALMEAMKPFMEQVRDKVKELSGYEDLNQLAVNQVATLLTMETKGIKDKAIQVKFTLDLFGQPLGIIAPDSKLKTKGQIEEASYEVVAPPSLNAAN